MRLLYNVALRKLDLAVQVFIVFSGFSLMLPLALAGSWDTANPHALPPASTWWRSCRSAKSGGQIIDCGR